MADDEVLDINGKLIYDLRVTDLKKELDKRALSKSGNKKELVERLKAQILLEKGRSQASADDTDDDDGAPNLSLPDDAPQNDVINEYLAKRRQLLQEQSQLKKQWAEEKSAEESGHDTSDEVNSPTKEAPNNHSPDGMGKRGIHLTRDGLAKLKPVPDDAGDRLDGAKSQSKRSISRELSPEAKDVSPTNEASNKEAMEVKSQVRKLSRSESKSPEPEQKRKVKGSSPEEDIPHSEPPEKSHTTEKSTPAPVRAKSGSRSPDVVKTTSQSPSKTPSPAKAVGKSRSPTPEKSRSRSPSPAKEMSESKLALQAKEKDSTRSRSPVKARSTSPESEKRSASSSSNESGKGVTLKAHAKSKKRGHGPVRSRRPASSSSSGSRSESSSSSPSSRSRSRSNSPKKKYAKRVTRSASRSRSPEAPPKKTSEKETPRKNGDDSSIAERKEQPMDTAKPVEPNQEPAVKKPDVNGDGGEPKSAERVPVVRRRRWGSTRTTSTKAAIIVSTDSLKGLIPEIKPSTLIQEPVLELAPPEEEEEKMDQEEAAEDTFKKDLKIQRTVTQEVNSPAVKVKEAAPPPPPAPVPENDDVRQVEVAEMPQATIAKEESKEPSKVTHKPRRSMDVLVAPDEPQPSRRSPSPARNPISCIIHIRNLVRPYTLRQLKEVLGRTGTLVENGFWIDNIKSHAYATYESEDQAKASRQALHGTRWPSSNPKLLRIDYATPDEVDYHKSGDVTPASIKRQVRQDVTAKPAPPPVEDPLRGGAVEVRGRKEDLRTSRLEPVREWDRDKVRQSRSRSHERRESDRRRAEDRSRDKSREQEKKKRDRSKERKERKEKKEETEEAPAKLLDDLFCKTKSTPCIYWLPLTEEQAAQRAQRIKAQEEERERRRKELLKKDEDMRRQREKDREERIRHRDGPQRRSPDRNRPGDRGLDKNRDTRGRHSRSRSRVQRRR